MNSKPRSAYDLAGGLMYFPRMLDKIRLYSSGDLHPDYHANLGKGADNWCVCFLRVEYEALKRRVLEGGTDDEILEWCFEEGRRLDDTDIMIWNSFARKLGWNDRATPFLEKFKAASGLADRTDILTMVDYFDVDEGRRP